MLDLIVLSFRKDHYDNLVVTTKQLRITEHDPMNNPFARQDFSTFTKRCKSAFYNIYRGEIFSMKLYSLQFNISYTYLAIYKVGVIVQLEG